MCPHIARRREGCSLGRWDPFPGRRCSDNKEITAPSVSDTAGEQAAARLPGEFIPSEQNRRYEHSRG